MLFSGPSLRLVFHYLRTPRPSQSTRKYATEQSQSQGKKSSEMPKFIGIASLAAGAAYYFQFQPEAKSQHEREQFIKGERREASTTAGQSAPEPDRDPKQKITASGTSRGGGSWGQPPSTFDAADARKEPGGAGTTSAKQEGLSNSTTDNPFMNEPGKSKKGEGETETAKLKGTVSTKRPQA